MDTNTLDPSGKTRTVGDVYKETQASADKALEDTDYELEDKDTKPTTSNLGINAESDVKYGYSTDRIYVNGFNDFCVDGNESLDGFLETVKATIIYLLQKAEDFLEWIVEFIFNDVKVLRRRLQEIKRNYHAYGLRAKEQRYPASVVKLAQDVNIPANPAFAAKSIKAMQGVYKDAMDAQKFITKMTRALPDDTTREQVLNLADALMMNYTTSIKAKKVKDHHYVLDFPAGNLRINCYNNKEAGFKGISLTKSSNLALKYKVPEKFIPTSESVQQLILNMDMYILDIESVHRTQRSFVHNFKTSVRPFLSGISGYSKEAQEEIKKYYSWLISFQNKSVNLPLHYYISVIKAGIDLCESQIQILVNQPKKG